MTCLRPKWTMRMFSLSLAFAATPFIATPFIATPGALMAAPLADATPASATLSDPDINARYTVYVGGFLFAEASLAAELKDNDYRLRAFIAVAGTPSVFFDSKWDLFSQGSLSQGRIRPAHYVFNSIEPDQTKTTTLDYDRHGMPRLTMDPPQDVAVTVQPFERLNTQDPVSAFLMPVLAKGKNPCERKLAIFDGKRRYDLQFAFEREEQITTRNKGYSGPVMVCSVTFKPGTGTERRTFTNMMRRNGDTLIWLASVDGGKVYMPVKLQMRTPIGGAIMEAVALSEKTQAASADLPLTK